MEHKLDGNAAAGTLQAIFPFEMTLVQATCTGCGATDVIGALAAYIHGMGTVALGHHIFQPVDRTATEQAWQAWLDRAFA